MIYIYDIYEIVVQTSLALDQSTRSISASISSITNLNYTIIRDSNSDAKTENSNVYYAAGWYAINFDKGWKHGNCPKLNTLITYGYEGPFKTKIELKQRLKVLNKIKRQASKVHAK